MTKIDKDEFIVFNSTDVRESKQVYINLSNYAYNIINEDIIEFSNNRKKQNLSNILSTIVINYNNDSNASINKRWNEIKYNKNIDKYIKILNIDNKNINDIKEYSEIFYKAYLMSINNSYDNGIRTRFRLNNKAISVFDSIKEGSYYDRTLMLYLKPLFEEYARLPLYKREQIIFKDYYDLLLDSINLKRVIIITLDMKYNSNKKCYTKTKMKVIPYEIVVDDYLDHNYLININIKTKRYNSIRLDKILSIELTDEYFELNDYDISKLEDDINKKKPQFIVSDLSIFKIRLTNKGIDLFKDISYNRPTNYSVIEELEDGSAIYEISCTNTQFKAYFLGFVNEVEVLEPLSVREEFKNILLETLKLYD